MLAVVRCGAVVLALLAWPAAAQAADAPVELQIPEVTITAEDPLILLPPIGPATAPDPLPLPLLAVVRIALGERPVLAPVGRAAPPTAEMALQSVKAVSGPIEPPPDPAAAPPTDPQPRRRSAPTARLGIQHQSPVPVATARRIRLHVAAGVGVGW